MVITKIDPHDVLSESRQTIGLSGNSHDPVDDVFLAGMLRRSAGIYCPCSRTTLRVSLLESLQYLSNDETLLPERVDEVIEGLIVGGDLLELNDVATDDPSVKGTWIFAAPPSFVVRPSGSIFLLGIVPDQDSFLPHSVASRITYEGCTRVIASSQDEELPTELREHGLQQMSDRAWMRSPKSESAENMLERVRAQLAAQPRSGAVSELRILDPMQPVTYYPGRWTTLKRQTGVFVARRPQEFGPPIWCFAAIEEGSVVRLLDLPFETTRWRGCDVAWHLQMAIDCCLNKPQLYRRRDAADGIHLDFFSPLPKWSQRRLMVFGRVVPRENSLLSYCLPVMESETEERFLQERVWLSRLAD